MSNLQKYQPSWLQTFGDFLDVDDLWMNQWPKMAQQPAVNVSETEKEYCIELAAPGFKKEDFKISADDGLLNISAERKGDNNVEKKEYSRREYSYSSFKRSFRLPPNIKDEGINAKYENGVLLLHLPKAQPTPAKPKKQIAVG
ncbi:MAG TPA: Hsp20/alpha crystallin family protein [Chitinophagaceae bacterium]|nr:Hsp20/alpha crystallin family protein [Chitinophagaceae bacterium]